MIAVRGLHKTYRADGQTNHVLRGVELDVAAGEWVALMGSSGSGKSTLLNVLGALDRDYDGSATLAGQELSALDDKAQSRFRNRVVGFVFQQFHLLPHMPVVDNVAMPGWFHGEGAGDAVAARARAVEVLEQVGLGHKVDARPARLSGGERQRVAIARALFNRPRLLLCDEPTGALDSATGEVVLQVFERLHRELGVTLLMVTHEPDVAARAQRVVRLRDGQIVSDTATAAAAAPATREALTAPGPMDGGRA